MKTSDRRHTHTDCFLSKKSKIDQTINCGSGTIYDQTGPNEKFQYMEPLLVLLKNDYIVISFGQNDGDRNSYKIRNSNTNLEYNILISPVKEDIGDRDLPMKNDPTLRISPMLSKLPQNISSYSLTEKSTGSHICEHGNNDPQQLDFDAFNEEIKQHRGDDEIINGNQINSTHPISEIKYLQQKINRFILMVGNLFEESNLLLSIGEDIYQRYDELVCKCEILNNKLSTVLLPKNFVDYQKITTNYKLIWERNRERKTFSRCLNLNIHRAKKNLETIRKYRNKLIEMTSNLQIDVEIPDIVLSLSDQTRLGNSSYSELNNNSIMRNGRDYKKLFKHKMSVTLPRYSNYRNIKISNHLILLRSSNFIGTLVLVQNITGINFCQMVDVEFDYLFELLKPSSYLEQLNLSKHRLNSWNGFYKILSHFSKIRTLDISECRLIDDQYKSILLMTNIVDLKICFPYIEDKWIDLISKLTKLESLSLTLRYPENFYDSYGAKNNFKTLSRLSTLKHLALLGSMTSLEDFRDFKYMNRLESLTMIKNIHDREYSSEDFYVNSQIVDILKETNRIKTITFCSMMYFDENDIARIIESDNVQYSLKNPEDLGRYEKKSIDSDDYDFEDNDNY